MDTTKRGVRGVKGAPKTGWRQGEFADFSIGPLILHLQFMNYFPWILFLVWVWGGGEGQSCKWQLTKLKKVVVVSLNQTFNSSN